MIAPAEGNRLTGQQQATMVKYLAHAQRMLRSYCRRLRPPRQLDLEGIEHDCLVRVVRRYADDEHLVKRLNVALRNAIIEAMRRQSAVVHLAGGDVPDQRRLRDQDDPAVYLGRLPVADRRLLRRWSRLPTHLSLRGAADQLGIHPFRLSRAIRRLRESGLPPEP